MGVNHLDYFIKMTTMKLKTVKDLKGFDTDGNLGIGKRYIDKEKLKDLAIKWIKKKEHLETADFMDFHNLTEEDLK